jgi:hypothetical protein
MSVEANLLGAEPGPGPGPAEAAAQPRRCVSRPCGLLLRGWLALRPWPVRPPAGRYVRLPAGDRACGGSGGGRPGRPPPVVVLERAVTGCGRVDPLRASGWDVEVDRDNGDRRAAALVACDVHMEPPGAIVMVVTTVSVGSLMKSLKSADVSWYRPRLIRPSVVLVAPEGVVAYGTRQRQRGKEQDTGGGDDDAFHVRATPFSS